MEVEDCGGEGDFLDLCSFFFFVSFLFFLFAFFFLSFNLLNDV